MQLILLLLGLWAWKIDLSALATPAPAEASHPAQFMIELSDGSRIAGSPTIDRLKINTEYASAEIPLSRIRTIEFSGTNHIATVGIENGDVLNGQFAATKITVNTASGQVVIPLANVHRIRYGPAAETALPEGLVLHYTFDTDHGDKVTDSSGAGNDGRIEGAPVHTSEGQKGGAMSFSGDGDAVIVGNPASLQLQDFTIMAWIKRGSTEDVSKTTEYGEIFGYGSGGYVVGIHKEGYVYLSQADVHMSSTSSFQIHDKNFHHVVVTKQGNNVVFYLDGAAYPAGGFDADGDFVFNTDAAVGARSDDLRKCFLGVIDEVAVFKRPLSGDEVKGVYESQK
jgi:hypothetical protein